MLVKTGDHEVQGNMPGQAVDMSLSSNSLEHIMDILSDLYSDRPAAIIREYGTNALDAHIISGQDKPIEISTPNRLNPNLVIRDYGGGMSKQVLIDTYSKYGASTKRNNNLEAGQLGLGSKSGFAYTDQFTVRSVHDGHCCELIMSRNDRGAAEMTIAFDYETGDDSGVTVTIPIKAHDIDSVKQAASDFAKFATPGTISLDGVVNSIPQDWTKIADNLYSGFGLSDHTVVMGNVAYPAKLFTDMWMGYGSEKIIAFVEMGEVDFAPSREALKYTIHTNRTLKAVEDYFLESIVKEINDLISVDDSRKNKILAYKTYRSWSRYLSRLETNPFVDVFGDVVEGTEHIRVRLPHRIEDRLDKIRNLSSGYGSEPRQRNFQMADLSNVLDTDFFAVTDFPSAKLSRDQARKILDYDSTFAGQTVWFFGGKQSDLEDLFDSWNVISWNDVKKIKSAPRAKTQRKKSQEGAKYLGMKIHRRDPGREKMMTVTGPSYYCSVKEWNEINTRTLPREDFKLFLVIPSKQDVFARKNPEAKSLTEYINNRRNQIRKHMRSSESMVEAMNYAENLHMKIDISKITNKDFLEKVRLAKKGAKWMSLSGSYFGGSGFSRYLEDEYPLVTRMNYYGSSSEYYDHAIQYINMIGEKNVNA